MNDQQAIEQAYSSRLQELFNTFVNVSREGDDGAAEALFKREIAFLRSKRDQAIACL